MAAFKYGSQGDDVKNLQKLLNRVGFKVDEDGIYGDTTAAAVRDFNEGEGLGISDEVTDETLSRLKSVAGNVSASRSNTSYKNSDIVNQAYQALNSHMAQKPGKYVSQWQTQLEDIMKKIEGREKFSYNFNEDALYQQYKDKAIQQGKMAMGDAIGQASAMTGGYGNSYAQSVGQQMYQKELQNLNDVIPELYQLAYDKDNQEVQDLYNQYAMLLDRENMDYGRYRDSLNDWQSERDYLTNQYNKANVDNQWQKNSGVTSGVKAGITGVNAANETKPPKYVYEETPAVKSFVAKIQSRNRFMVSERYNPQYETYENYVKAMLEKYESGLTDNEIATICQKYGLK